MQTKFQEVSIRRQLPGYYLPVKSNITSHYAIFTIELLPLKLNNQRLRQKQTDDMELGFSNKFMEFINQNSQRANSISTKRVFSIIHYSIPVLDTNEAFYQSPQVLSIVRREFNLFSQFSTEFLKHSLK